MSALEHIKQKYTISGGHCGLYVPDLIKLTGKPYSELRNELNALYKDKKIKVRPGSKGNLIMLNKRKWKTHTTNLKTQRQPK